MKKLGVLLLFVLLAGLLWFTQRASTPLTGPDIVDRPGASPPELGRAPDDGRQAASEDAPLRTKRPTARAEYFARMGPWRRVVAAGTRAPVGGAELVLLPATLASGSGPQAASKLDLAYELRRTMLDAAFARERGFHLRTDAAGRVRLPSITEPWRLEARTTELRRLVELWPRALMRNGEMRTRVAVEKDDASCEVVLELHPRIDFEVRVLGHDGRRMPGVSVRLTANVGEGSRREIVTAQTDDTGLAELPFAEYSIAGFGPRTSFSDLRMEAHVLGGEDPFVDVSRERALPPRIELRLPPCGTLQLVAAGERHEPPLVPHAQFQIELLEPDEDEPAFRNQGNRLMRGTSANGSVSFHPIAVGARLYVSGEDNGDLPLVDTVVAGPMRDGETVRAPVAKTTGHCCFLGVLVGPDGAPRSIAYGNAELFAGQERVHRRYLTANESGVFLLLGPKVGRPLPDGPLELRMSTRARRNAPPLQARVRLQPGQLQAGTHRLGEVQLVPLPLLVGGTVVDDSGKAPDPSKLRLGIRVRRKRSSGEELLERLGEVRVTLDSEGRFEAYAAERTGPFFLCVEDQEHGPQPPTPFTRGERSLRLSVTRRGGLRGRLLLPEASRASALFRVTLLCEHGSERRRETWLQSDGAFVFRRLPPDEYRLQVRVSASRELLVELPGLRPLPGEDLSDPRMAAIDLRTRLRRIHVTATGPDGRSAVNGFVLDESQRALTERSAKDVAWLLREGRAEIFTARPALDLLAVAAGCAPTRVTKVTGDTKIRMHPGTPLRIVCRGRLPSEHSLSFYFRPAMPSERAGASGRFVEIHDIAADRRSSARYPLALGWRRPLTMSGQTRAMTAQFCAPGLYLMTVVLRQGKHRGLALDRERPVQVQSGEGHELVYVLDPVKISRYQELLLRR